MSESQLPNHFPIFRPESEEQLLIHPDVKPSTVLIENVTYRTLPLRANKPVNLIGLSIDRELLLRGIVDMTDCLHEDINLKALYFQANEGTKIAKLELGSIYRLKQAKNGNFREYDAQSFVFPIIEIESSELLDVAGPRKFLKIGVLLVVNIETGNCFFQGTVENDESVKIVGYELDYALDNYNRRPTKV